MAFRQPLIGISPCYQISEVWFGGDEPFQSYQSVLYRCLQGHHFFWERYVGLSPYLWSDSNKIPRLWIDEPVYRGLPGLGMSLTLRAEWKGWKKLWSLPRTPWRDRPLSAFALLHAGSDSCETQLLDGRLGVFLTSISLASTIFFIDVPS